MFKQEVIKFLDQSGIPFIFLDGKRRRGVYEAHIWVRECDVFKMCLFLSPHEGIEFFCLPGVGQEGELLIDFQYFWFPKK